MVSSSIFSPTKKKWRKAFSSLLLIAMFVSEVLVPLNTAWAAEVTIDGVTVNSTTRTMYAGSETVFISDQVGYRFYIDSTNFCVYEKTSDGGATWAAAVSIDTGTTCFGVSVWYDRWTPGDTGNIIHILTMKATGLFYNNLDTTTDTRLLTATPINTTTNSGQTGTPTAGTHTASIAKGTDGTIYMSTENTVDSYVVECSTNCGVTTSWTETGTSPMPLSNFFSLLVPLSGGDILLLNRDVTNDDMLSKVWHNGTASWDAAWTTIDANAIEGAGYGGQYSAAVNLRTGDVYLAYINLDTGAAYGGNNDDIKTAIYSGGAWTAKADVVTNITAAPATVTDVKIALNAYNGDVYVGYSGRTTAATNTTGNVYWKSSTNGMTSWSAQTGPINITAQNMVGLSLDSTSDRRLHLSYQRTSLVLGDTIAAITPATTVAAFGTQKTQLRASTTAQYVGGGFAIADTATTRNVTGITISEVGTVDGANDIKNIKLVYDLDTTAPYDCASESYGGSETQFGSTDTDGFSAANGGSSFSGTVSITTTQTMCVYAVMDVKQSASTKTIDIQITNPLSQVTVSGTVLATPMSTVAITGATTVVDSNITQTGYHWRNDDNTEAAATSDSLGVQNTAISIQQDTPARLRIGVSNSTGATTSLPMQYRLEYAQNPSTCSAATGWTDVNATTDAWDMYDSTFLTNGSDTTNIATANGGVTDVGTTFVTPNGGQLDTSSQSGNIALGTTEFTELEYSIIPATTIPDNTSYCFRVTNAGTVLPVYSNYAQATVKLTNDFKIQRGIATIANGATTVTITAGTNYEAPSSTSTAFIRITNTGHTGAGRSTSAGNSNASDVMAYVSNPENLKTSITFTRTGTLNNDRISWEIIEYKGVAGGENEIKVRKAEVLTYVSANATVNGTNLTNVAVDADVVPFITGQGNPSAARTLFTAALSTSAWDSVNHRTTLTRSLTGAAVPVSTAYVEFTGSNWKIQRTEHTYTAAGATETNAITAVNSLSRTFIHVQKRASVNTHANYGAEVWLSGIGQVSFLLDAAATTPAGQTSVAWIIENTQTSGKVMTVTRSNGLLPTAATFNQANNISIGVTIANLTNTSIFVNNRSDTATATWPEPILGVRIISTTQYELWRSDAAANVNYRTEVVEWPTATRKLTQSYYRLYVDNNALKPTDPWPAGAPNLGENTEMTANDGPMVTGDKVRIRVSVAVSAAAQPAGTDSFKLQYGRRTSTCGAVSSWSDIGDSSSTTAMWRGVANAPADGTLLSTDPPTVGDLLLSVSTVAGTYEEANNTPVNAYTAFPGDQVEYDWVLQDNGATDKSSFCFRMVQSDGTLFTAYTNYPVVRTVGYEPQITDWRWYDDETSLTPTSARAIEDVSPSSMEYNNAFKLRVVLREVSGANGLNVKFALQYSEYADFSQGVFTVTSTSSCSGKSLWCFYNGAGTDNAVISSKVISSADACSGGVGNGCGTYNESATPGSSFTQQKYANTEYEFTIRHDGARSNRVYYFRVYNLTYNEAVVPAATYSYPSLVTEGATLTFAINGLNKNTSTAGITTDATTTSNSIAFGSLPFNTDYEAAQRVSISTNATEGYQVLLNASAQLLNSYGDQIPPVTSTNASPAGWATGCNGSATGCFGYHTTDATLAGGSTRFAPTDSYAQLATSPGEIMYSSIPTTGDTNDLIYKMKVNQLQPAGDYTTTLTYIAVPVH
jgi:hypothetical protein